MTPKTQTRPAPQAVKEKTATITCEECGEENEISQANLIRWRMNMSAPKDESERCCRICGLSFKQCPVGGI